MTKALSTTTLLLSGACLAMAIWYALHLFIPDAPYPRLCRHWFLMNLAGMISFYLLHQIIRNRCRQREPRP